MSYPPPPPGSPTPGGYPPAPGPYPPTSPVPQAPPPPPPGPTAPTPYPTAPTPYPTAPLPGGAPPGVAPPPGPPGYGGPTGPGGPGAYPPGPPGQPPQKKRSKLPFIALGLVALLLIAAVAVVGLTVLKGDPEAGEALSDHAEDVAEAQQERLALAAAVREGDPEALIGAVDEADDVIAAEAEPATLGEDTTVPLGDAAMAIVSFDGEADTSYTVSAALADGDGTLTPVALPPERDPVSPASVVDATVAGEYRVLVVADEGTEGDVTVRIKPVEVVSVELSEDDEIAGELSEPGDAVEYEFAGEAGQHYLVYLDADDGTTEFTPSVLDPDGNQIDTTIDRLDMVPRFVAETSGDYRIRVTGGMGGATGPFTIEVVRVAEYFFFYGDDPEDPTYIARTQEQFQPRVADDNRAHFCVFIREGITINIIGSVNDATLDMGIDVFGRDEAPPLETRINEFGPGLDETWTFTANTDQWRCIQLWGVDFTGGSFSFRFTTES